MTTQATVTNRGITYHRRHDGGWRQDCGIDMPERDWRWLDRIAKLEADNERLRVALTMTPTLRRAIEGGAL